MEYNIVIEKTPDNWYIGQCVQLPEAMSQGRTLAELLKNMKEAIQLVILCQKDEIKKEHRNRPVFYRRLTVV